MHPFDVFYSIIERFKQLVALLFNLQQLGTNGSNKTFLLQLFGRKTATCIHAGNDAAGICKDCFIVFAPYLSDVK